MATESRAYDSDLKGRAFHALACSRHVRSIYGACRRVPVLGGLLHVGVDRLLAHGRRVWARLPAGLGKGLWFHCDPRFALGYGNGDHEPWVQEILEQNLEPGNCFCDVGAHTGFFSLIAARLVGERGLVVPVEGDPENAALLRANAARNSLPQVKLVEAVAWSSSGQLRFEQANAASNRTEGHVTDRESRDTRGITVAAVTLDDLFFQQGLRGPQLVKIDVEGAEWEVLQGAQRMLREIKPQIVCEVHDPGRIGEVQAFLGEFGYVTEHWRPVHPRYPEYQQHYVWATARKEPEEERGLRSQTTLRVTPWMQKEKRKQQLLVGLVGLEDQPTDAVREYCGCLSRALGRRGVTLETAAVAWEKQGWSRSLWSLWRESSAWQGCWILVQFTWLMWSRRGFPVRLLFILALLKVRRAKIAMVFHDSGVGSPKQGFNRVRLSVQNWVMRRAYQWTDRSLFNIPLDRVPWLPSRIEKACFIPVGANVPSLDDLSRDGFDPDAHLSKIVAVFGVSGSPQARQQEVQAMTYVLERAARKFDGLRLLVMGRGAKEAEPLLRQTLNGTSVDLQVRDLLPALEVSRLLASSDVMLFVRGALSSRRGSGLAGIACGVPIVAYRGEETGPPVTEAGVTLVCPGDLAALAEALITILKDQEIWKTLHARNMLAHREHFSWNAIAGRVLEALGNADA